MNMFQKSKKKFKPSFLAKLFRKLPYHYNSIDICLAQVNIATNLNTEEILYENISYVKIDDRSFWKKIEISLSSRSTLE